MAQNSLARFSNCVVYVMRIDMPEVLILDVLSLAEKTQSVLPGRAPLTNPTECGKRIVREHK
jgi:hypothetical protein